MFRGRNEKSGKEYFFENPSEKGRRFAGEIKKNKGYKGNDLTPEEKAYRKGYLAHSTDSAEAYCAKNGIESKSKKRRMEYFAKKKNKKK